MNDSIEGELHPQVNIRFVKIVSEATIPKRASKASGAYDIYSCHKNKEICLKPGERIAIPTGLIFEIPNGYIMSVRPRSGLAIKNGITMINSPGTIDADYRGEVKILLINHGQENFIVTHGMRIAQILLEKTIELNWLEISEDQLTITERGDGGFGSTGTN